MICNTCGRKMDLVVIPCPENRPGCLVQHSKFVCNYCDEKYRSKYGELPIRTISETPNQKKHLTFIYERLINVYKENPNYDYMIRLKEMIDSIPGE